MVKVTVVNQNEKEPRAPKENSQGMSMHQMVMMVTGRGTLSMASADIQKT